MTLIRVGLQQRVLADYRLPLFDQLATALGGALSVFAGEPEMGECIPCEGCMHSAKRFPAQNTRLFNRKFSLWWQKGWREWLAQCDPEVVILEANPRYLSNLAIIARLKAQGIPCIGWGLGAPGRGILRDGWRKMVLGNFSAIITYSQQGAAEYAALGFPQERIFVACNAQSPCPQCDAPQRATGFQDGVAKLIFVGRLQQRKRIDTLLHACSALSPEVQPDLWIVGEGPARAEWETMAGDIYPRAQFLGPIYGTALADLLAQADLFVLPGTGGLAIQQAMTAGLPVMVGEADGTQQDLVREGNGWQLPSGDIVAWTTCLEEALGNPSHLRGMGLESFRIVKEEINLEAMVGQFLKAIEVVLR